MPDKDVSLKPKTVTMPKLEKPKLYKVLLHNDDYTPREFVTLVLKVVFRMSEETGYRVMMTAHMFGSAVVVVCTRDIAETKVKEAMDLAKEAEFPLMLTAEPEDASQSCWRPEEQAMPPEADTWHYIVAAFILALVGVLAHIVRAVFNVYPDRLSDRPMLDLMVSD
eukprot:gene58233-79747_t